MRYLMCRPTYFAVDYAINPWMDPAEPVDVDRAVAQWTTLRETYLALGHTVDLIEPLPGLPDMVFAANGALVVDDTVLGVQFATRSGPPRPRRTCPGSPGRVSTPTRPSTSTRVRATSGSSATCCSPGSGTARSSPPTARYRRSSVGRSSRCSSSTRATTIWTR